MSSFTKNLQKFLVLFFTASSVVLVTMGIIRIKKVDTISLTESGQPNLPNNTDTLGSATITGTAVQTPWGDAVAAITVKDGKIIAATMPSIPDSPPSVYAVPYLIDQAVKAGSANIQGVSGATYTSIAFKTSLESAISKAEVQGETIVANASTGGGVSTAKPSVPRKYRESEDEEEHDEDEDEEWDD